MAENPGTPNISNSTENGTQKNTPSYLFILTLTAIGVVYGDIGTSPLYALRECFNEPNAIAPTHDNILGVLSLIFWALILIISIKYLILILRADNEGEGGILALMELVKSHLRGKSLGFIITIGLFGAALLYGDGIITPAISVLSAVEGLKIATPFFEPYIIPLTLIIIFVLFFFQSKGTGKVGIVFGPITLLWFITIAILGSVKIFENPAVIEALNPYYGFELFQANGFLGFLILGVIFLVVTGGEALYADMGHFGRFPIRLAWFAIVLPSLVLNYFGQGALLLNDPSLISSPFYYLAPEWALYPLVILAMLATVIASQAVISGAFSLTFQALQLGYLPRMKVYHTSEEERGQIYIPKVNWLLFIAVVGLILTFRTSSNLASAYGIAVTSTMVITTILAFNAMRKIWKWGLILSSAVSLIFLAIDLSFWGATMMKFLDGGWVPLLIGAVIYILMRTWRAGRRLLSEKIEGETAPMKEVIPDLLSIRQVSIPGTAVYMWRSANGFPPALIFNLKHNKILHKQIIILTLIFGKTPHTELSKSVYVKEIVDDLYKVIVNYGFNDKANVLEIMRILEEKGLKINYDKTSYFLGRETIIPEKAPFYKSWSKRLFSAMFANAENATDFFGLPPGKVLEVGAQIKI